MKATGEPLVLLSERLAPITDDERRVELAGARLTLAPLWNLDQIVENAANADVVILGAVEPFDAAALDALPNLKAVVRRGVGTDNVDVTEATRLGFLVANVPDATVEEVSDQAFALLLALERRIVPVDRAVHDGVWQHDPRGIQQVRADARRLSELTLGVVGFGRIGQAVARKGRPIYARILAADPYISAEVAAANGAELVSIPELLASADHVSLNAPATPETRHLINATSIATMKPGAMLVNTARGALVDEQAVIDAVASGHLGGAGLDATEHEPLPEGDPLLTAPGILLTAHSAAWSKTATVDLARRSVDAALDLIAQRRPASIVNSEVLSSPNLRLSALGNRTVQTLR